MNNKVQHQIEYKYTKNGKKILSVTLNANLDGQRIFLTGFSLKQIAYKYCEQKKSFAKYNKLMKVLQSLPQTHNDPYEAVRQQQERDEERLADICDDLNCSVSEARHFQNTGEHPRGW